jgi:hypothetical protein
MAIHLYHVRRTITMDFTKKCLSANEVFDTLRIAFIQKKLTLDYTEETHYKELGYFISEIKKLVELNSVDTTNNI